MTTLTQAREAVYERFVAQWADRIPYTFSNEAWDEPDEAWARLTVKHLGQGGQDTMGPTGGRKFRRNASVFVQIFVPINDGMQNADGHIEVVKTMFEGVSFDGLDFTESLVREDGPTKDGKFDMTVVESLFAYEEIK